MFFLFLQELVRREFSKTPFYCFYCAQCALFGEQLCKPQEIHLKPFKAAGGVPLHLPHSHFLLKQLYTKVNSPLRV